MPERRPALLLPYAEHELRPRRVSGRTADPLVPVDQALRLRLQTAIGEAARVADEQKASAASPLPVRLRLRARALAKTKRPYSLLADLDLTPIGATTPGTLILPGTARRLENLAARIGRARSQVDVFSISTIEEIAAWDVVHDVFGARTREDAAELLRVAARDKRALRVTFFPWVADRFVPDAADVDAGRPALPAAGTGEELIAFFRDVLELDVVVPRLLRGQPTAYIRAGQAPALEVFDQIRGIRTVALAPEYSSFDDQTPQIGYAAHHLADNTTVEVPSPDDPVVGVLDSGVSSSWLEPGVAGRSTAVPAADADPWHGTFVAGLLMAGAQLNGAAFPTDVARVHDAHVLPRGTVDEGELYERVREAVLSAADVKVWNCSFASHEESDIEYGSFARQLDALSDEAGVLFVQAAGNLNGSLRQWPPRPRRQYQDGLASPAEALRSLTVGARAHKGGIVQQGAPASYSRRGPNFAELTKPEVSHAGGDRDAAELLGGFGVLSLIPSGHVAESVGTSFATPAVSAIAANLWDQLADGAATEPTPELVKGLIVHSAFTNSLADPLIGQSGQFRQYYGWGTPSSTFDILADEQHTLTTVHQVLMTPGVNWYKRPFPVPPPLLSSDGKFSGEVVVTISYAPPIDFAFGAEAIRYDISGSFGAFRRNVDGTEQFNQITRPGQALSNWEGRQKADGKWAPVKTHRAIHPSGIAGGDWALRLEMTERVTNEVQQQQQVYVIVTFRSLDPAVDIYTPGVAAFDRMSIEHRELIRSARIRVDAPSS